MSKNQAKSFAEEGLEDVLAEAIEAEAALPAVGGNVADEDEGEMVQVGGLEPITLFYRTSVPKKQPKQPFKVFEKGEVIKGTYEKFFTSGKFGNNTYVIRREDGALVGLPGAGSLKRAMDKLVEGSKVVITYAGMSTIKNGQWAGSDAHNFTVLGNKLKK